MEWFGTILVFIFIIGIGFYIMGKIDEFRRKRNRDKGIPMDEED